MYPYYPGLVPPEASGIHLGNRDLSEDLMHAIDARDVPYARAIFETAFWNDCLLVPDWWHLLRALDSKSKPMIRLLVARGAGWTKEEALCLREFHPEKRKAWQEALRGSGLSLENLSAAPPPDDTVRKTMLLRILNDKTASRSRELLDILKQLLAHTQEIDGQLQQSISRFFQKHDAKKHPPRRGPVIK